MAMQKQKRPTNADRFLSPKSMQIFLRRNNLVSLWAFLPVYLDKRYRLAF